MSNQALNAEAQALERQAIEALRRGQEQAALTAWRKLLSLVPQHAPALTQVGQAAFKRGDFTEAHSAFLAAAQVEGRAARPWVNVALAAQQLGDTEGEEQALFRALTADPYDLLALVLRGGFFERQGMQQQAASAYGAAATVAPPLDKLAPELRPAVTYAMNFQAQYQDRLASFMDDYLAPHLKDCGPQGTERFQLSLDILLGRKRRYDAQPMRYFMPQLPAIEFFDRASLPWLDAVEAQTDAIRDECLAVLHADDVQLTPYITYGSDQPLAQWAELNHSERWSVFHLVKDGQPVAAHAARCPITMQTWSGTPWPDQPGRTPVAMFSALKPKTRIPPHVGASNCRLVTHLPLIVPPGCGFRVGNQTREWVPGKAWVFDDTIEHEAWNDSHQLRVVLIFDTWHPMLSAEERRLITAMNRGLDAFSGGRESADYDV